MRVGISTSVVQRGKTGVAQYLFALLKAFQPFASQHQFTLFVLEEDLPLFSLLGNAMQIVPVPEKFRSPVRNILWHQTKLPALARQLQLDVLHVPSYRRLLWSKPCGIVGTIHDLAPFHVSNKYDWKRMFYGRVVVRHLAWKQDEIIAISENTAQDIQRFFGLPREKLTVIHNGLDHDRFHPTNQAASKAFIQRKHGLTKPFFLYVARLEHPGKNHVRLISAFNTFKQRTGSDWQLVFGGSDWHGSEAIHEEIQQSPFASDIRPLGFVANEELPDLYRAADAFVYPSLYEGFGMPPTEAMACGCPVICSARGSLGEVVGNAAALVDPENIYSMCDQLMAVAGNPALREQLRLAGFVQAQKFNWSQAAATTLKVYERAAARVSSASTATHSPTLNLENESKAALR